MNKSRFQKKRATVLNADVVGFSAMMAHDSEGTIQALLDNTRWLARAVEAFGGRVVDAPGDNLMAEFPGEGPAVRCAMYVQWQEDRRNRHLPAHLRIRFRIGLHSGEVYQRAGRLYGTAVNVAARLQEGAEPGGLLVSAAVAEGAAVARGQYRLSRLKNIPEPVTTLAVGF